MQKTAQAAHRFPVRLAPFFAYEQLGKFRSAKANYKKSVILAEEAGDLYGQAEALWSLAKLLKIHGRKTRVRSVATKALKLTEQIDSALSLEIIKFLKELD